MCIWVAAACNVYGVPDHTQLRMRVVQANHIHVKHFVQQDALMLHAFLPHNLMHHIHDDILPVYATLDQIKVHN